VEIVEGSICDKIAEMAEMAEMKSHTSVVAERAVRLEEDQRRDAPSVQSPVRVVQLRSSVYIAVVKPGFDRIAAAVGLLVAAVPMAAIALAISMRLSRPVIFRQTRIGQHGEEFEVLKFRTMAHSRRGAHLDVIHDRRKTHKSGEDPRHTTLGRLLRQYSLDELPQLINVLRGEMSFVGPRPELASVVADCYRPGLEQRHQVKPGLTGLWQISARGDGPMHENGEWDLDYVEQISLLTDARILIKTPGAILGGRTGS
jgi:lipopolysaccharide/colanic/teichoic acid biosynthesis glycosyltransferase